MNTISDHILASVRLLAFDFDGVMTDNAVYVSQDGVESVRCWRSDGLGLARIRSLDIPVVIISTEINPVVSARAAKLQVPCRQGVEDKAEAIRAVCRDYAVAPDHAIFVGNDINDIPAFQQVGIPIAVADAYPEVDPYVIYRTRKPGGYGAVREVCDLVFHALASRQ